MVSSVALLAAGPVALAWSATSADANEFLDLDITQLLTVTVSSVAKRDQRLADAAAAVFVISQEDIRRSGVTNLPDALAMAPGIQVAKISASKWSVSSRGFTGFMSNKLLVLIDGRSVYSPLFSGVFWDAQNVMLEDVERIEVIRGPGSTLWGANAVNGVINIITKKAEETQGGLVRVSAGDQEPWSTAARYGGKVSNTAFGRFYAMYNDHGSNILADSGADADDDWQPMQGGFRMDGKPGSGREWTLQGDLFKNQGDQIISPFWNEPNTPGQPFYSRVHGDVDVSGGNLLSRWHQELRKDSGFTVQAYFDSNTRDEQVFNWRYDTVDLDLQYETAVGQRQRLTMGGGYRSIRGDLNSNTQMLFSDRNDALYSALLQDEINLVSERVWLTVGSKYEHNDYSGNEWQPSARLLWKPVVDHSFWTSVARAVVTPTVVQQSGRVAVGYVPDTPIPMAFVGNPGCMAEILWAYEAGYRWQASRDLSFDLALFYNDYQDLFTMVPDMSVMSDHSTPPSFLPLNWANGVSGYGQGFELSVDWKPTAWISFVLAYSYLDLDFSPNAGIANDLASLRYSEGSALQQVSLRSSLALADNWRLNLWGRYTDSIYSWDQTEVTGGPLVIDGYFGLDANVIWTPNRHLELMLAGQNLLNSSQVEYRAEYSTPTTAIERGVYGKLTWRF